MNPGRHAPWPQAVSRLLPDRRPRRLLLAEHPRQGIETGFPPSYRGNPDRHRQHPGGAGARRTAERWHRRRPLSGPVERVRPARAQRPGVGHRQEPPRPSDLHHRRPGHRPVRFQWPGRRPGLLPLERCLPDPARSIWRPHHPRRSPRRAQFGDVRGGADPRWRTHPRGADRGQAGFQRPALRRPGRNQAATGRRRAGDGLAGGGTGVLLVAGAFHRPAGHLRSRRRRRAAGRNCERWPKRWRRCGTGWRVGIMWNATSTP